MKMNSILNSVFGKSEDFVVGRHDFSKLSIKAGNQPNFFYFYDDAARRLIKQFVLDEGPRVDYLCQVTLIKKGERFSPRLCLSVRDKARKIAKALSETETHDLKANVNLTECHESFWKLISYLQSLRDIEIPSEPFSLVTQDEAAIVGALSGRDPASIVSIIKQLSTHQGVKLTESDVNQLLNRRDKLAAFDRGLAQKVDDESKWQTFFEDNKWIFGYGLNYQIIRQEQSQPHYGGTKVDGTGGQKGDYLTATDGDYSFTVLVEIKTPATPLLRGSGPVRNGAWALSSQLTDAISQIQANVDTWDKFGSMTPDNRDALEGRGIYTVQPKGIVVIGCLSELDNRDKLNTFQRFRKSVHGIDIITFDELHKRAAFIVDSSH